MLINENKEKSLHFRVKAKELLPSLLPDQSCESEEKVCLIIDFIVAAAVTESVGIVAEAMLHNSNVNDNA